MESIESTVDPLSGTTRPLGGMVYQPVDADSTVIEEPPAPASDTMIRPGSDRPGYGGGRPLEHTETGQQERED